MFTCKSKAGARDKSAAFAKANKLPAADRWLSISGRGTFPNRGNSRAMQATAAYAIATFISLPYNFTCIIDTAALASLQLDPRATGPLRSSRN